jgi:hypothetical protein
MLVHGCNVTYRSCSHPPLEQKNPLQIQDLYRVPNLEPRVDCSTMWRSYSCRVKAVGPKRQSARPPYVTTVVNLPVCCARDVLDYQINNTNFCLLLLDRGLLVECKVSYGAVLRAFGFLHGLVKDLRNSPHPTTTIITIRYTQDVCGCGHIQSDCANKKNYSIKSF